MILGIDTTAGQCAVAVVSGDRVVRRIEQVRRGFDMLLFSLIADALGDFGAGYADLERIVCCTGPGSFVGVRIGVAAARGLALGTGAPAVGVSRFEALVAQCEQRGQDPVAVVLAGRGDTVFFQAFSGEGTALDSPRIISIDDPEPGLLDGVRTLLGDGAPEWQAPVRRLPDGLADPGVLARIGAARQATAPPAPLYLRPPAADLPAEAPPRILD